MPEIARRALLASPLLMAAAPMPTVFDFTLDALEGGKLPLAAFRGRALMVVNTASFCGFTPQYAALQRLQAQLSGVCAKVDTAEGQRATCQALLKPAAKKAT